ncbi:MAG: ATP-binding protein [Desulfatiglandales bacterium]
MTAAMIDRLTHKSYLLNMNGSSYRLKETREWLAGQEQEEKDELN